MSVLGHILLAIALIVGLFFNTMGVLGILRFPDVYTRLHADTKATTFGSIFLAIAALLLVLCGLCTSVMWGTIFDLAVEGLGAATEKASGIFMAMVVGGGILPLIQNFVADKVGYLPSYWVLVAGVVFILYFAAFGSKMKKA